MCIYVWDIDVVVYSDVSVTQNCLCVSPTYIMINIVFKISLKPDKFNKFSDNYFKIK